MQKGCIIKDVSKKEKEAAMIDIAILRAEPDIAASIPEAPARN